MHSLHQKAVVCCNNDCSNHVQVKLNHVLSLLGYQVLIFSDSREMMNQLQFPSDYKIFVVGNLHQELQNTEFKKWVSSEQTDLRPSIISMLNTNTKEFVDAKNANALALKKEGCFGIILDNHTISQMAFVINQCMYKAKGNKRKSDRALAACKVKYFRFSDRMRKCDETFSISCGGLFLKSVSPQPKRAFLRLEMFLEENSQPIHCSGRVVYNHVEQTSEMSLQPSGMGIRFSDILEEDRKKITDFISLKM